MVLEIHVQILTSSRLSAITGTGNKMGADTPARALKASACSALTS